MNRLRLKCNVQYIKEQKILKRDKILLTSDIPINILIAFACVNISKATDILMNNRCVSFAVAAPQLHIKNRNVSV